MKPIENKIQTFTKLHDSLRRISVQKITSTQKIFFAYILGWQESDKTLTATNNYIAEQLGLTYGGLRKVITPSNNRFDFFSSSHFDNEKRVMISLQRMKSKLILQIGFHLIKMNKKKHPKKGAFENGLVNV